MPETQETVTKERRLSDFVEDTRYFPLDIEGQIPLDDGVDGLLSWLDKNLTNVVRRGVSERKGDHLNRDAHRKLEFTEGQAEILGHLLWSYADRAGRLLKAEQKGVPNKISRREGAVSGMEKMLSVLDLAPEQRLLDYLVERASAVEGTVLAGKLASTLPDK